MASAMAVQVITRRTVRHAKGTIQNPRPPVPQCSPAIGAVLSWPMHEIHTEIAIRAPSERVWSILTDFRSYPSWNPFITHIEGKPEKGHRLRVTIKPVGGRPMTFKPTILWVVPKQGLRWLGHLYIPGLFDGDHSCVFEQRDSNTRSFRASALPGCWSPFCARVWTNVPGRVSRQ
jgi:hypothetical protein